MKTIDDLDVAGKRVLVRADLNVPLDGTRITDDGRIRASVPTLKALLERGAKVIVTAHLGRPKGAPRDAPDDDYRRGLCLVYGLGGPERADRGVASLRRAASADLVEAQMALADYFQAAAPALAQDALYWYRRAGKLGDARAAGRAEHLERRIRLDAERPAPPPDTIVNPTPLERQALYRQGYHCHAMLGEQWCHIANDI